MPSTPSTRISPKVTWGAVAAFAVPILLTTGAAGLSWLATSDGSAWLTRSIGKLPLALQILIPAFVAALSSAIAGYLKADPARYHVDPPDSPADSEGPVEGPEDEPEPEDAPAEEPEPVSLLPDGRDGIE